MKKIIILKNSGGELANQLWNYMGIYACGFETNRIVTNPSFFEYHSFFNLLEKESILTKFFSLFFQTPRRKFHIINRMGRFKYSVFSKIISLIHTKCIFSSENTTNHAVYIPPTNALPAELENCQKIYFKGWLFRNPIGLKKFKNQLIEIFKPNTVIEKRVEEIFKEINIKYKIVLGVHIRQADYQGFKNNVYLIEQKRVKEIIDEYIQRNNLNASEILFLFTSDGHIEKDTFTGLNMHISEEDAVTDLFLLSRTQAIIGSDSSFGNWAAWYGNIPHIIMKQEPVDWFYYSDKKEYFENKYCTMVHF